MAIKKKKKKQKIGKYDSKPHLCLVTFLKKGGVTIT